jgi:hypothetical protein
MFTRTYQVYLTDPRERKYKIETDGVKFRIKHLCKEITKSFFGEVLKEEFIWTSLCEEAYDCDMEWIIREWDTLEEAQRVLKRKQAEDKRDLGEWECLGEYSI